MARFCPDCGQRLGAGDIDGVRRQVCSSCGRIHYLNPKPAVAGVLVRDGRVLLSRRARDPMRGAWDLPGGFLEAGEEPQEGLARELLEETAMRLTGARLLGAFKGDYGGEPTLNLLYSCEAEGEPAAASDSAELRWFPLDALPAPLAWPHEEAVLRGLARGVPGEP